MKPKFISKHRQMECWTCRGTGRVECNCKGEKIMITCPTCKGTGKFIEESWILVYKNMAFQVDGLK